MITKEIQLFTYDELNDSAKETAKQWWLECMDLNDLEFCIDDFVAIVELMGFTVKTHEVRLMNGKSRTEPNVWWSLSYSQSDHAGFDGWYKYKAGFAKAVKAYAPMDKTLHGIADALQVLQRSHGYLIAGSIKYDDRSGVQLELNVADWLTYETEKEFREIVKSLNRWLYDTIQKEHEYQTRDEQIAEAMSANEYTFRANGKRED
jgi:hypothetical protein